VRVAACSRKWALHPLYTVARADFSHSTHTHDRHTNNCNTHTHQLPYLPIFENSWQNVSKVGSIPCSRVTHTHNHSTHACFGFCRANFQEFLTKRLESRLYYLFTQHTHTRTITAHIDVFFKEPILRKILTKRPESLLCTLFT